MDQVSRRRGCRPFLSCSVHAAALVHSRSPCSRPQSAASAPARSSSGQTCLSPRLPHPGAGLPRRHCSGRSHNTPCSACHLAQRPAWLQELVARLKAAGYHGFADLRPEMELWVLQQLVQPLCAEGLVVRVGDQLRRIASEMGQARSTGLGFNV